MTKIVISPKVDDIGFVPLINISDPYPLDDQFKESVLEIVLSAIRVANTVLEKK